MKIQSSSARSTPFRAKRFRTAVIPSPLWKQTPDDRSVAAPGAWPRPCVGFFLAAVMTLLTALPTHAAGERITGEPGNYRIHYLPMPDEARNPWAPALEEGFWQRTNHALGHWENKGGGLFFESEKWSYPNAFIDFLQGNRERAIAFLQKDDDDPHAKKATLGVDWYPSFTIKSQARKYFFFGQYLDPAYKKKMFDSAKVWTDRDPLNRPNDFFQGKKDGWNVESKNSWVDVRNTDNLRAMRECAVYLMAEETGNTETAKVYKDRIRAHVSAFYNTGLGEWDSANYLHHTMTGYFQLYDFAKDPEVRLLAKGALDWLCTAAAVKYFHGNWAGPNKRDYNNLPLFEGAPGSFWFYFDDTPHPPEDPERDLVHWMTSPYRPPEAVVALARKDFPRPVEILSSKPSYDGWFRKPGGDDAPSFHETLFISDAFQVGTLPGGHDGDVSGFRMATVNPATGSDLWVLATALKGYVKGIATATAGGDRIAQYRNLIIQANPRGDIPFYFFVPKQLAVSTEKGVSFLRTDKAWVAITPVNAVARGIDEAATKEVCAQKRPFPDYQIWAAQGSGTGPAALILEIGDSATHGTFEAFQKAVLAKSRADLSKLSSGEIHYTGSTGESVGLRLTSDALPVVFRNGHQHDWATHNALYACTPESKSQPISLGWKEGILRVQAGGKTFTGTLRDGRYSFTNQ